MNGLETSQETTAVSGILAPVRRRLRLRKAVRFCGIGLLTGCIIEALVALVSTAVAPVGWAWVLSIPVAMALLAAAFGFALPTWQRQAATLVDAFYNLKDRAITAMQFSGDPDPVRQMQVREAEFHLRQVDAADCVPIQADRRMLLSAGGCASVALAAMLLGNLNRPAEIDVRPVGLALEQADFLQETMLDEIEKLAKEQEDAPELEELAKKLEELTKELKEKSIDERDMMATLSEMEQVIAEAQKTMNLEMNDAQLKAIADAIQASEAMKQVAASMEKQDYDSAGDKLEAIDPNALGDKERRAVADNLKKFLAKLSPGPKGQISAAQELQQGLEKKNDSQCKSECRGQGNGDGKNFAKSNSPSLKAGKAATGNPNDGEATELDSTRREEHLTGVQGDRPSESEVLQAPEGEQDAVRGCVKRYQNFRSQAEAVLDSEPLPLGHRQTVRQYFENTRPDAE